MEKEQKDKTPLISFGTLGGILNSINIISNEDIDIFIHFPNGFQLFNSHNMPSPPRKPKVPDKPSKNLIDRMNRLQNFDLMPPLSFSNRIAKHVDYNVNAPDIQKSKSYDVSINVKKLKHHLFENIDTLCLIFDLYENAHSFKIEYQIIADNIPEKLMAI